MGHRGRVIAELVIAELVIAAFVIAAFFIAAFVTGAAAQSAAAAPGQTDGAESWCAQWRSCRSDRRTTSRSE